MKICGIKLTHDAAIALIDNGRLIFSNEIEKTNNNARHSEFDMDFEFVENTLAEYGYRLDEIDSLVIDGWNEGYLHRLRFKDGFTRISLNGYDPITGSTNLLSNKTFEYEAIKLKYKSYLHVSGHALGAYCSSPLSANQESSYILVWDGAVGAQLYYFDSMKMEFQNLGWVHYIYGCAYAQFANRFFPFSQYSLSDESTPGKIMAYIAKGNVQPDLLKLFHHHYDIQTKSWPSQITSGSCREFSQKFQKIIFQYGTDAGFGGDDMMTTFHHFLSELLVSGLRNILAKYPDKKNNLCYAGGCALNIKWNSHVRSSGLFTNVWVPPFPNDSGSAIGVACCEMVHKYGELHLDWTMFDGPALTPTGYQDPAWHRTSCSLEQLSRIIHYTQQPVVFLNGRAELGPRALGHRSILAAATSEIMKDKLNDVKKREGYRPVAPICIEEYASDYFEPGIPDPLMLFDHQVKFEYQKIIPAICHLDGTARLQTVNSVDNPEIYQLLHYYKKLSKIPLLCNTSANHPGCGFFPNVESALRWGKVNFIWSENELWHKKDGENDILWDILDSKTA